MATVRPGVMQAIAPVKGAEAEIIEYDPGIIPNHNYVEIMDIVKKAAEARISWMPGYWYQEDAE